MTQKFALRFPQVAMDDLLEGENRHQRHPKIENFIWRLSAKLASLWNERHFRKLDADTLCQTRKSERVYIFGSGYSLNALTEEEWREIERFDTMSFNWFAYQKFLRIDYHVIRETLAVRAFSARHRVVHSYCKNIAANPLFDDAVLISQEGWTASSGNRAIGSLPKGRRLFRYRNRPKRSYEPPSESFDDGIVHGPGTLVDCTNIAALMGWTDIILVGIDLYDRRYFWLADDETNTADTLTGNKVDDAHQTSHRIVGYLGDWAAHLKQKGINLWVYNPRSLLSETVPVWQGVQHDRMKASNGDEGT